MDDTTIYQYIPPRIGRPPLGPKKTIRLPKADWDALDARTAILGIRYRSDLMRDYITAGLARPLTIQIETSPDGKTWEAINPSETIKVQPGDTAASIANSAYHNQNIADGVRWRLVIWEGTDTNNTPAYIHTETENSQP